MPKNSAAERHPPPVARLRQQLQDPCRNFNDIGGVLFGDWVSIYFTWCFIRYGIGPTLASYMMLVFGIGGSILLVFGGAFSVLGAVLVVGYYIADCVDGEVARYRGCVSFHWSFHDLLFGIYVQTAFYLGLGLYVARVNAEPAYALIGVVPAIAILLHKIMRMAPHFLVVREAFLRTPADGARVRSELELVPRPRAPKPAPRRRDVLRRYGLPLGVCRAVVMNFDLALLLLVALAVADLWLPPVDASGIMIDGKTAFLLFYALARPLDLISNIAQAVFDDGFRRSSRHLLEELNQPTPRDETQII
ncbi:MAG: hypothetical protein RIM84_08530 [Alphaproteobacteria bacterium]